MEDTKKTYWQTILPFVTSRTKAVIQANPTILPVREDANEVNINIFNYDATQITKKSCAKVADCLAYRYSNRVTWINMDGIRKKDVEWLCNKLDIHALIQEDILSISQRPKMDEINEVLFCLLNMLYFNDETGAVEQEQISLVLGKNFVLSIQEDATRDVFDGLRERLQLTSSKVRQTQADYLFYALLDTIVDHYFLVLEKIGERIEVLEEAIIKYANNTVLSRINTLRKEMIVLKRNIAPVRELISNVMKTESRLIEERTFKYFKDIQDHIIQANDLADNLRDMIGSLHDLYLSKINLRLNEVMKVMTIVTCLLAPAAVIGGIFGMNFDVIPYAHQAWGFYLAVACMLVIPIGMIWVFKKRGWF